MGSSDLIGNPIGLIDKVGDGFIQLARDPILGLAEGSPKEFIQGVGSGVQGVVRGVVGGFFGSTAQLTGSFYEIIKETTGQKVLRTHRVNSLPRGIYYGIRELFREIYLAVEGLVLRPYMGCKEKNSYRGFIKGVAQGLAGLLGNPFAGLCRLF